MRSSLKQADVAVIGGGPAGGAAALTLAQRGARVLLVERPERRTIRVGEGLPPAARPLLQGLGLWDRFQAAGHLPSLGNRSAWGSRELAETDFIFNPYGHGWHLDRPAFDAMLVAAAENAGAVRLCTTQAVWEPSATGGVLRLRHLDREHAIQARAAIDCTGRAAVIAHQQGARRVHRDKLVAVAALHAPSREGDADSTTLVEAVSDGWWYTALLPGGCRIFVYLTDGNLLDVRSAHDVRLWPRQLSQTEHLQRIHKQFGYRLLGPPTVVSASSSRLRLAGGRSWLAAGDAAISFDPLSSQGIITAISTGRQAAEAILELHDGKRDAIEQYLTSLDQIDWKYLSSHRLYYARERRWTSHPFWRRRAAGDREAWR